MIEPRNFVSDLSVDKVLAALACTRIALTGILEAPTNDFAMYYVCHVIDWCDHFNTLVTQSIVKSSYIDRRFVVRGGCDCNEPSPITHHPSPSVLFNQIIPFYIPNVYTTGTRYYGIYRYTTIPLHRAGIVVVVLGTGVTSSIRNATSLGTFATYLPVRDPEATCQRYSVIQLCRLTFVSGSVTHIFTFLLLPYFNTWWLQQWGIFQCR